MEELSGPGVTLVGFGPREDKFWAVASAVGCAGCTSLSRASVCCVCVRFAASPRVSRFATSREGNSRVGGRIGVVDFRLSSLGTGTGVSVPVGLPAAGVSNPWLLAVGGTLVVGEMADLIPAELDELCKGIGTGTGVSVLVKLGCLLGVRPGRAVDVFDVEALFCPSLPWGGGGTGVSVLVLLT